MDVTEVWVHRADAVREFVHAELPEEYGTRLTQLAHHGRVRRGNPVLEDSRAGRRPHATRGEEVLHGHRNPVQRAAVTATGELALGFVCLLACEVRGHGDKGVQPWLDCFDAAEARLGQLERRKLSRPDQRRGLLDAE